MNKFYDVNKILKNLSKEKVFFIGSRDICELYRYAKKCIGKKVIIYVEDLKEENESLSGFNASYYGTILQIHSTCLIIETNARRKEKHILCWGLIKFIGMVGD